MSPDALIRAASEAFEKAHAPYSGYRVGAALLCADGTLITGCNVENASYGLTNCAERTAIFTAASQGQRRFEAMAIASSTMPAPFPCGACRQVLAEFCGADFPVYIAGAEGYQIVTLGELLPYAFGAADG